MATCTRCGQELTDHTVVHGDVCPGSPLDQREISPTRETLYEMLNAERDRYQKARAKNAKLRTAASEVAEKAYREGGVSTGVIGRYYVDDRHIENLRAALDLTSKEK